MTLPGQSNTPALIVDQSESPAAALIAFIAQELEHKGFAVRSPVCAPAHELAVDTVAGTIYLSAGLPDL